MSMPSQFWAANRVDASRKRMQAPGGNPMINRIRAKTEPNELLPRHDPVLFLCKPPSPLGTTPHRPHRSFN
jgi:hypothetical protein